MSLISAPYYEISCNGSIDNIRHPNCPSVSAGGFDQEAVVGRALGLGWTELGRGHRCPGCSFVAVAPEETVVDAKPERKARRQRSEPVETGHFDGQQS